VKSKLRAVSDTSFISVMHGMGYLSLCSEMFEKIYVSQSVYDEVKRSGMRSLMAQIEELIGSKFIIAKKCGKPSLLNLLT